MIMLYSTLMKAALRQLYGQPPAPQADRDGVGLVLVADGVGGLNLLGRSLQYVMPPSGLTHTVRVVTWGHGFGRWHSDLTNVHNHAAQARLMATQVETFHTQHPSLPVFLVGKSGGCGVVLRALKHLPEKAIEAVVLVAPALSPGYDLSGALQAVRREMVVFWSPLDVFVLGAGTRIFGTMDRVRSVSAGLVGFRLPERLDEAGQGQYTKLRQVRWHPRMAQTGYLGGHVGPDSPRFLRNYVVPLLSVKEAKKVNPDGPVATPLGSPLAP
ncbi:MAG TPA: alpha/beta hydrolase [Isosphaeraceae bacterium]|nr:alpha/beta hydrolase [Isosphaeraceae bacterium]